MSKSLRLAEAMVHGGPLPEKAGRDATHIALGSGSRDALFADLELHTYRQRTNVCEDAGDLRGARLRVPGDLHSAKNCWQNDFMKTKTWESPIVLEVRKVKERLAAKFNYDIDGHVARPDGTRENFRPSLR